MGVWRWRYVFNIVYETIDVIIVIGTFTMSVRRFHDVGHNVNSVNYVNIDAYED